MGNDDDDRSGKRQLYSSFRPPAAGATDVIRRRSRRPRAGAVTDPPPAEPLSHPLDSGTIPRITGDEDATTSLTTLLEEPLPKSVPPIAPGSMDASTDAALDRSEESAVLDPPRVVVERAEPAREAVAEPAAPTPAPSPPRRSRARQLAGVALGLGAVVVIIVAWAVNSEDERQGVTSSPDVPLPPATSPPTSPAHPTAQVRHERDQAAPPAAPARTTADPIAVLPAPRTEVLGENLWVRRNRAAGLRADARGHYAQGDWLRAAELLSESLEWDPTSADAQRNLSRIHQRLGEMELALAWARRAIATDPTDPRSHELLGDQLLMLDRREDAAAAYRTGIEAAPRDVRLRSRLRRMDEVR